MNTPKTAEELRKQIDRIFDNEVYIAIGEVHSKGKDVTYQDIERFKLNALNKSLSAVADYLLGLEEMKEIEGVETEPEDSFTQRFAKAHYQNKLRTAIRSQIEKLKINKGV